MPIYIKAGLVEAVISGADWNFIFWRLVEKRGYRPEFIHSLVSAYKTDLKPNSNPRNVYQELIQWFKL